MIKNRLFDYLSLELCQEIKEISLHVNSVYNINRIQNLRKKYPEIPVGELLSIFSLQRRYQAKLKIADNWILTDKNAQQASSYHVAQYHGLLFQPFNSCADLCCGIGMDLYFLSQDKALCYAVDLSEEILTYAEYNMSLSGKQNVSYQCIRAEDFSDSVDAVFIDPDRRIDEKRSINPFNMSPDLPSLEGLALRYPKMVVKLSPMLDYDKYDFFSQGKLHFVSENNELKEILFCSKMFSPVDPSKTCVILPEMAIFKSGGLKKSDISAIQDYLYEPDVSIIKAHLIEELAYELNLNRIDPFLALLTSNEQINSQLVKNYKVDKIMDFSLKEINVFLNKEGVGRLDIKTRGFSETVEAFRKKIKLGKEDKKAVLFIIKIGKKHYFIVCDISES